MTGLMFMRELSVAEQRYTANTVDDQQDLPSDGHEPRRHDHHRE
jgi:hypothetical protein